MHGCGWSLRCLTCVRAKPTRVRQVIPPRDGRRAAWTAQHEFLLSQLCPVILPKLPKSIGIELVATMGRGLVFACAALQVSALVAPRTVSTAATKPKASFVADFMTAAQNAVASAAPGSGDRAAQKLIDVVCAPGGVDADAVAALCASYAQYDAA